MKYNPFADQKFVTTLVDVIFFLCLYFAGKYAPPSFFDDVKVVFGSIQPLVLLALANMFVGDAQALKAGRSVKFLR
jgi:hypothetical protein